MASTISHLLFLASAFIAFAFAFAHAVSDSNITVICSTTLNPDFCSKTLKNDPTWSTTDLSGLGQNVLKQSSDRAKYVPEYLGSVTARATAELAAKYEAASKDFDAIIAKFDEAAASFKKGDVNAASDAVKTAFDAIGKSLDRFKQPPKDLSEFRGFSLDIQTLSQAFMTIVNLLGH